MQGEVHVTTGAPGHNQGSTIPRRQLGRALRELRDAAGITSGAVAREMEWDGSKVWRIESAQTSMRRRDVRDLCEYYGADERITEALVAVADQTKAQGWWHSYLDAIPKWFQLYVGLEAAANHIRMYDNEVVSGLLQTEDYMHVIMRADDPSLTEAEYAARVSVRLERQGLLTRQAPEPPRFDCILNEGVLRRPAGGSETMAGQLAHLVDMGERDNVSIRVLPLAAGLHRASIAGAFTILDFPVTRTGRQEPPVVYSEGATGALYLDKPKEVAVYRDIWQGIEGASLDEECSRTLITKLTKEVR